MLAVLRDPALAPPDLRARSLQLAGELLEFCGHSLPGRGRDAALRLLDSGAAWAKFQAICEAQGGLREPGLAPLREPVLAQRAGWVGSIDCRRLARVAKLAGAPDAAVAGLEMHVRLGDQVQAGMPLFTLHAVAPGELAYARSYLETHPFVTLTQESVP